MPCTPATWRTAPGRAAGGIPGLPGPTLIRRISIVGHYAYKIDPAANKQNYHTVTTMSYQFLHIEGYARTGSKQHGQPRKWSAQDIADEAMREPDACPHVEQPQPPVVLYGCTPDKAAKMAHDWADVSKDAKGRKLRRDGLVMLAGVVSLPSELRHDWPRFREATVAWLKRQYGERLRSVIEHTDEAHPHLHFYAVPLEGERFEVLHPGRHAAAEKARQGAKKGAQNAAYKAAMVRWQDDFSSAVAANFGLARLGPGKRRLTRGAWKAEQEQARALAVAKKAIAGEVSAAQIDPKAAAVLVAELKQKEAELKETEQARDAAQTEAKRGWKTVDEIRECLSPRQWSWLVMEVQKKRRQAAEAGKQHDAPGLG